jgi:hypothetical protein
MHNNCFVIAAKMIEGNEDVKVLKVRGKEVVEKHGSKNHAFSTPSTPSALQPSSRLVQYAVLSW